MPSYAIMGTSRGIGLEFVNQLAKDPDNQIFALARNPKGSEKLQELVNAHKNVIPIRADMTKPEDWAAVAKDIAKCTGGSLDVLIHNAAVVGVETVMYPLQGNADQISQMKKAVVESIQDNVLPFIDGTNALLPLLLAGETKKVIVLSSAMGLPELVMKSDIPGSVPYSASKSTLNLVVAKFATELKPQGVRFLSVSPGWVDTQERTPQIDQMQAFLLSKFRNLAPNVQGPIPVEQSVRECLHTIGNFDDRVNGLMVSSLGNNEWLHS